MSVSGVRIPPTARPIATTDAGRATSVRLVTERARSRWTGLARADVENLRSLRPTQSLAELFAADPRRGDRFTVECAGLVVDLSRNLWDDRLRDALIALAERAEVGDGFRRLAAGERLNVSENRPVGHLALRSSRRDDVGVDGSSVRDEVESTLDRMASFVHAVTFGDVRGSTGRTFTDVVNIGIGGSDLGPAMAHDALREFRVTGLRCRFVANLDAADIEANLADLDPETTLVVVASKTFTTLETMANATVARRWLSAALGEAGAIDHLVAVTANPSAADEFGVGRQVDFSEGPARGVDGHTGPGAAGGGVPGLRGEEEGQAAGEQQRVERPWSGHTGGADERKRKTGAARDFQWACCFWGWVGGCFIVSLG